VREKPIENGKEQEDWRRLFKVEKLILVVL
jgi:hypothetical protein